MFENLPSVRIDEDLVGVIGRDFAGEEGPGRS